MNFLVKNPKSFENKQQTCNNIERNCNAPHGRWGGGIEDRCHGGNDERKAQKYVWCIKSFYPLWGVNAVGKSVSHEWIADELKYIIYTIRPYHAIGSSDSFFGWKRYDSIHFCADENTCIYA